MYKRSQLHIVNHEDPQEDPCNKVIDFGAWTTDLISYEYDETYDKYW